MRVIVAAMASIPYDLGLRTRDTTVLGRLAVAARKAAPGVGRWLGRMGRKARRLVLHLGGLGAVTAAAWMVAVPLGLLVGGVALLVLEYLSAPESELRR